MTGQGRVVIALGGNAILQRHEKGTAAEQVANIRATCRQIAQIAALGHQVVLTHGNGPQVGNRLIQNEEAVRAVPALPLDVCVAETQGQVGYWFQQVLRAELAQVGLRRPVATVVTQVVVNPGDPAFEQPSKPIGPFYTEGRARALMAERGWAMREDAGRGWRRVVPSPEPGRIVELETIKALVDAGAIIIAAGGGGVPVIEGRRGLVGVEAVIDKDMAAQRLAADLRADLLLILTDVRRVMLFYGGPAQLELDRVSLSEAEQYQAEGHFPPGSMGNKVEAAVRHLRAGGKRAVICHLRDALEGLSGRAGTQFVPDSARRRDAG